MKTLTPILLSLGYISLAIAGPPSNGGCQKDLEQCQKDLQTYKDVNGDLKNYEH
jgi:hypothetical protein